MPVRARAYPGRVQNPEPLVAQRQEHRPHATGSDHRLRVQKIAAAVHMHEEYLRELIRRFNDDGFDALKPRPRSGRPKALTEEEKSVVAEVATAPPQAFGRPFNQWSLRKLRQCLLDRTLIAPITVPTLRSVLKERKISFQRTRTWKRSNDPDFDAKKNGSKHSIARRRKARR